MTVEGESELRMALRHVQTGRRCITRQLNVVATLRSKGLPTAEAETVLQWLEETQQTFEGHYQKVLSDGFADTDAGSTALPPFRHTEADAG
jgi:hypothetical protein